MTNHNDATEAAVLVIQTMAEPVAGIEEALSDLLRARSVEPVHGLFKPSFVHDGRAQALLAGDWKLLSELELAKRVDALVIARVAVSHSPNPQMDGLWTANLTLGLNCLQVTIQRGCGSQSLSAQGAGFSKEAATQNAVEKMRSSFEAFVKGLTL